MKINMVTIILVLLAINTVITHERLRILEKIQIYQSNRYEENNVEIWKALRYLKKNLIDTETIAISNLLKINHFIYKQTGQKIWFEIK